VPGPGKLRVLAVLLPLLASGWLGSARADEVPVDPDLSTEGTRRAGPLHFRPYLLLRQLGYDDNIQYTTVKPVGDTVMTLAPGIAALLRTGRRGGVFMSQEFAYTAFANHSELNHWDSQTRLKGMFLTRQMSLSLEDSYSSIRARPNLEIDQRIRQKVHSITAALNTLWTGRVGLETYVRRENFRYEQEGDDTCGPGGTGTTCSSLIRAKLNRHENRFSALGTVRILPKTRLTIEGRIERTDFEVANELRNTRAIAVLPGLRFDPAAAIQGSFYLGVLSLVAPNQPRADWQGLIGKGTLGLRTGNFGRITGTYGRDLEFSAELNNLYFISTHWTADYDYFFSRRMSAGVLYGNGLHDYPNEVRFFDGTAGIRQDDFTTYQLSIGYRAGKEMSVTAQVSRLMRDSTEDYWDLTNTRYWIGTGYFF